MSRLILKTGEGHGRSLDLKPGPNRIGRDADNDIVIACESMSGRHCEVILDVEEVRVRDLDSTNGTFIDGRAVTEAVLQNGQLLQLGDQQMIFDALTEVIPLPVVEPPKPSASQPLPDGSWSCIYHHELKALWRCTHCLTLYCNTCVQHLRRMKGKFLNLCPQCSYPCELVDADKYRRKRGFFGNLKKLFGG